MAYCISKRILISWIIILGGISNSAQSACVTRPQVTLNGNNNPSTSIRLHWQWFTTSIGCVQADDIRIQYALTNRDQCQQLNPQPTPVAVSGPNQFVLIDNLEPYSTYTITYELYLGFGRAAYDDIHVLTGPGNLGVPEGIQNIDKSPTHLTFSWSAVPCGKRHGPISSYNLQLSEAENPGIFTFVDKVPVQTLQWTFTGRDPSTEYIFEMRSIAETSGGLRSEFSSPLHAQTYGTDIPAPASISVSTFDSHFVLSWTPVDCSAVAVCSSVTGYKFKLVSADGTDARMGEVHSGLKVTLTGLPCIEYTFQVNAITDAGIGTMSSRIKATLSALTEPTNLRTPNADADSITIEWEPPISQGTCTDLKITGYRIEISQGLSRQNVSVPVVYSHEFRNLIGNQIYTIRIKTIGEGSKESHWSQAISTYTNEGVSSKPQNVRTTKITSKSITIEWNPPRYPNGDITYYDVRLLQKDEVGTLATPNIRHTDLETLKVNFPDLLANTTYIFSIRANKDDDNLVGEEETLVVTTGIMGTDGVHVAVYIGVAIGFIVVLAIIVSIVVSRCRKSRKSLGRSISFLRRQRPELMNPIVDDNRELQQQPEILRPGQRQEPMIPTAPQQHEMPGQRPARPARRAPEIPIVGNSREHRQQHKDVVDSTNFQKPFADLEFLKINLGRGRYGIIQKGNLKIGNKRLPVAIKTVQENANEPTLKNFQNELEFLTKIIHQNIVSLVGFCVNEGKTYMMLDYANYGNLLDFLRQNLMPGANGPTRYLNNKDLIKLALDVAKGMEFLAGEKIIHRELMAKNVLVNYDTNNGLEAKVSDFGLSRVESIYVQHGKDYRVPIEWMPIEAIENLKFSTHSDMWAFGVLMWEIFTFGDMPYSEQGPSFNNHEAVAEYLRNDNNRLRQPENCDKEVYDLMRRCWNRTPEHRPSFIQIVGDLENMI